MRKILTFLLIAGFSFSYAQNVDADGNLNTNSEQYVKTKSADNRLQGWYISGKNSLQFNQAAFKNWVAGGVNSYAFTGNLDYEFNLTKGKHIWDNHILLAYGILKNEGETYRKSDDIIDLTSSYGYEFKRHWYFATALNFKTQFTDGFNYDIYDSVTDEYQKISGFMAPAYIQFGLGVDYKPNKNLQVNIHPLTSRFIFVTDKELQYKGNFGLKEDGDSFVYELGAFLGARYKIRLAENITYDNRLGIFSNYLEKPENMVVAYQGVLDLKVTKFISSQVTLNLFYDEDQIRRTQFKETLGIGLSYNFDNTAKLKELPENLPSLEELQSEVDKAQKEVDNANKKLDSAKQRVLEVENR